MQLLRGRCAGLLLATNSRKPSARRQVCRAAAYILRQRCSIASLFVNLLAVPRSSRPCRNREVCIPGCQPAGTRDARPARHLRHEEVGGLCNNTSTSGLSFPEVLVLFAGWQLLAVAHKAEAACREKTATMEVDGLLQELAKDRCIAGNTHLDASMAHSSLMYVAAEDGRMKTQDDGSGLWYFGRSPACLEMHLQAYLQPGAVILLLPEETCCRYRDPCSSSTDVSRLELLRPINCSHSACNWPAATMSQDLKKNAARMQIALEASGSPVVQYLRQPMIIILPWVL